MRVFTMFNTTTIGISIAPPTIAHFRWGWDSNPWVPLMLHYLLPSHRKNIPMFILRTIKPPYSLSGFSTSTNMSMRFCRNPMLSTSSAMLNTGHHTSSKCEISSCYICRKSTLQGPTGGSSHFNFGLTLSPRLWVVMILSSTLHPSLVFTQFSMWTFFGHIFHHYWTPQRLKNS
jgi:hypothetical protein